MDTERIKKAIIRDLEKYGRTPSYSIGDVIKAEITGRTVYVHVERKEDSITDDAHRSGNEGWEGEVVERRGLRQNKKWEKTGRGKWGYDNQVKKVVDTNPTFVA